MNAEQSPTRTAFGAVHKMPTREEVREQKPTREQSAGPGAVPRALLTAAGPAAHVVPESCVNFTLPGGGALLMTVPTAISSQDALFAAGLVGQFLTSLADRMKA